MLFALGIRHVGVVTAEAVAAVCPSLDALLAADAERLAEAEGVGPVVAESVREFLAIETNRALLERLRAAGADDGVGRAAAPRADGPLTGLSVVVTGGLDAYTRDEAKRAIARAGGKATGSVSRSTAFVVAGVDPGSKLQKAEAAGRPGGRRGGVRRDPGGEAAAARAREDGGLGVAAADDVLRARRQEA